VAIFLSTPFQKLLLPLLNFEPWFPTTAALTNSTTPLPIIQLMESQMAI
jgi:hypothetical protein